MDRHRNRRQAVALAVVVWLALPRMMSAEPAATVAGISLASADGVQRFDYFTNIDYRYRPDLTSWRTTRQVIARTLRECFPQLQPGQQLENGTPADLARFMHGLAVGQHRPDDIQVVYIAGHQSKAAELFFGQARRPVPWFQLLSNGLPPMADPHRLVILDSCYAAGVARVGLWDERVAAITLCAANAEQLTFEFDFTRVQPINLKGRFPEAAEWLYANLPEDWNGRISFLGLIWTLTWLETPQPPRNWPEMLAFVERVRRLGLEFPERHRRRNTSEIVILR